MKIYISTAIVLAIVILSPQSASAYLTSNQTAKALTPLSALYTITYSFGPLKSDFYMPFKTERNLLNEQSNTKLGYNIDNNEGEVTSDFKTAGIVFSDAVIKNGMYYVPAGTVKTFTLVTMLRTETDTPTADYKLQVENLPFIVDPSNINQVRFLNQYELENYATETISLNK